MLAYVRKKNPFVTMLNYAAYLFEKLVYGDDLPKAECNRKLEVIKTLSAKDIEFVNAKVAGKLEKVYTILKELASEKSAENSAPLSTYKIEKSTDELLEQIKQAPLKDDTLETAARGATRRYFQVRNM